MHIRICRQQIGQQPFDFPRRLVPARIHLVFPFPGSLAKHQCRPATDRDKQAQCKEN
jgi:hypothetical protein